MGVADDETLIGHKDITVRYTEWGEYRFYASFLVSFGYRGVPTTDTSLQLDRLWADNVLIYDRQASVIMPGYKWTYRAGTEDQTPIAGDIAYRGQILLWFEDFPLKDYGNRVPTISAEFSEGTWTLADTLTTLAERAGYAAENIETINLTGNITGLIVGSDSSLESITAGIATLYNFTFAEVTGKVSFHSQYDTGAVVVDADIAEIDLGVLSEKSSDDNQILVVNRKPDDSFPRRITGTFFNVEANFEAGSETAARSGFPKTQTSEYDLALTLPLVMAPAEMRSLLHDALFRSWSRKNSYAVRLPPEFIKYDPGEVLRIAAFDATYTGVIVDEIINADHSMSVTLNEVTTVYAPTDIETQPTVIRPPIVEPYDARAVVIDVPDRTAEQTATGRLNLWVAMGGTAPDQWNGARLDMALARMPTGWTTRMIATTESGIADVLSTWTAITDVETLDDVNELTVQLNNMASGDFVDATEAELEDGTTNLIAVGKFGRFELMQFTTAVNGMDPDTVVLSGLRRGLYGTEIHVNSHAANDTLVFMADTTRLSYPLSDFLQQNGYLGRCVGTGQDALNVDVFAIRPTANSRRPMAPINAISARDADTGDIVISWERRARYYQHPSDGLDQALDEATEKYNLAIYSADWSTLVRQETGLTSSTYVYTITDQEFDETADSTDYHILVFQISDVVGPGFAGVGTTHPVATKLLAGTIGPVEGLTGALGVPAGLAGSIGPVVGLTGVLEGATTADLSGTIGPLGDVLTGDLAGTSGLAGTIGEVEGLTGDLTVTSAMHRYWRINVTLTDGETGMDWSEAEFLLSGVDQTGSGTASASSYYAPESLVPANAFDNNGSTRWASDFSGTWPQWLAYDFGTPVEIDEVSITRSVIAGTSRGPRNFTVDWSDDNASWTTILTVTGSSGWGSGEKRNFPFP